MTSFEEKKAALACFKIIQETLNDPTLIAQVEKAHSVLQQAQDAKNNLDREREDFRREVNVTRAEIAQIDKANADKEAEIIARESKMDKREPEISRREQAIEVRDRASKTREQAVSDKETIHANNIRALQAREQKAQEKELQLAEREKTVQLREDKLRDALK